MSPTPILTETFLTPGEADLLQGILSGLPDPAMLLDARGRFLWAGRGALEFLDCRMDVVAGLPWQEITGEAFPRADRSAPAEAAAPKPGAKRPGTKRKTILLVEDEEPVRS